MPRSKPTTKSKPKGKSKSDGRTKRVRTTTVEEKEIPVEEEEEKPAEDTQPEDMPEPEPEKTTKDDLPDFVRDLFNEFDNEHYDRWHVAVDRWVPEYTSDGIKLRKSEVKRFPGLFMSLEEITEIIRNENGGGTYFFRVMDARNRIRRKRKVVIEGLPIATPEDYKHHRETIGELPSKDAVKHEEEKDEEDRLERERRVWNRKLEAERARREFERERRRLDKIEEREEAEDIDDEEDETDDRPFRRGSLTPEEIAEAEGTPLRHRQQPRSVEDTEKILDLKYRNRELETKLSRIEERMETIQDTLKVQPTEKSSSGLDMVTLGPVIVEALKVLRPQEPKRNPEIDALKEMVRDLAQKIERPQTDPVEAMIKVAKVMKEDKDSTGGMKNVFETMLPLVTGQMQAGNQMLMQSMQEMNKTQSEIMRQGVMQILEGDKGETDDWKTTALKKGLDTVETFGKEIVGFNKEKLKIEEKKLQLIDKGRIVPTGQKQVTASKRAVPPQAVPQQPAPKRPIASAQPSSASPAKAVTPKPPASEVAGVSNEKVAEIYTYANNLLQAAIQAFLKDEDPAEFAKKTLEIGGPEVTEWLLESQGISAIEALSKEFGQEESYNKWIAGNMLVKTWLGKWIDAVKVSFKFEGGGEAAVPEELVEEPAPVPAEPRKKGRMEDKPQPMRTTRKAARKPAEKEKPPAVVKKKVAIKKKAGKILEKIGKEKTT